jgi:hypothetical protein
LKPLNPKKSFNGLCKLCVSTSVSIVLLIKKYI